MADVKISALTAIASAALSDLVASVQGGVTYKATLAQVRAALMPVLLTADVTGVLPTANQAAQTMTGQVTGTTGGSVVAQVNGSTVPAGGALTIGNILGVTGAGALGYAPLNLGGGANFVTGVLPAANVAQPQPVNRAIIEKGASYALVSTTDYQIVFTGAGPWTATLPGTPAAGDEYVITNESSANVTVASTGGLIAFLVAGSNTVAPGQSVTFRKSTTANWIAS